MSQKIRERVGEILNQLNTYLYEKETVMQRVFLSAIAGESTFLIGPPGVAKSLMARRLKYAFSSSIAFEYLMGKFSTPDEIFGPVSISKLKNEDKYERMVDHYLPGANIIFLDEIWKASPAIQNALLTVLNEKVYRNGEQEIKVDIRGLIAASNELPLKGEGLEALWDRFLIRLRIDNIQAEPLFNEMITLPKAAPKDVIAPEVKITDEEYHTWQKAINQVTVPRHVLGLINRIKFTLAQRNNPLEPEAHIYISDRRWRKIVHLLRTSAFLNGRSAVNAQDALLISDCIWQELEQIEEVYQIVIGCLSNYGYRQLVHLDVLQEELQNLKKEIQASTQEVSKEKVKKVRRYPDKANQDFVRIIHFWNADDAFIRLADFEKMASDQETYVPVFEQTAKTFRPFQTYAFKRVDDFLLASKGKDLELETEMLEEEIIRPKVPSRITRQIWDQRISLILQQLDQDITLIEQQKSQDLAHAQSHLFVSADYAGLIEDSLNAAINELVTLRLEVEKTQHDYASLAQD